MRRIAETLYHLGENIYPAPFDAPEIRRMLIAKGYYGDVMEIKEFFKQHDAFLRKNRKRYSGINRLDARYRAIVTEGQAAIAGSKILDIGSHDGRWSFAALASGAKHVVGIEPRPELVDRAKLNMQKYGIPAEQYNFIVEDAHDAILNFAPGAFDTVFCLGFLYHTARPTFFIEQFARLGAKHIIIDTAVSIGTRSTDRVVYEATDSIMNAVGNSEEAKVIILNQFSLEEALRAESYRIRYFDWSGFLRQIEARSADLAGSDYHTGKRVTIHAERV